MSARFPFPPDAPVIEAKWFGPGSRPASEDATVRPFKIAVKDEDLQGSIL
jgi:hypothetical protein